MPWLAEPRAANYTGKLTRSIAYDAHRDGWGSGNRDVELALEMPLENSLAYEMLHSFPAVNEGGADVDEAEACYQCQRAAGAKH